MYIKIEFFFIVEVEIEILNVIFNFHIKANFDNKMLLAFYN